MNIVIKRNLFEVKKLAKGSVKRKDKFMYWINIYGFGIIITNTCRGLMYDVCF